MLPPGAKSQKTLQREGNDKEWEKEERSVAAVKTGC